MNSANGRSVDLRNSLIPDGEQGTSRLDRSDIGVAVKEEPESHNNPGMHISQSLERRTREKQRE